MSGSSKLPITVIVLTRDEEKNLPRCLAGVTGWAHDVFVVDSGSTDRTRDIAVDYGASVVEHEFTTHAGQWAWALAHVPIATAWVFGLDADQCVTPELAEELRGVFADGGPAATAGYYVARRQIFRGRWIRYGGYYPKYLLKLFRRDAVRIDEGDLVDHHFRVSGPVGYLRNDIVEDNANEADISVWTAKHVRYAALQARETVTGHVPAGVSPRLFGTPDERTLWLKTKVWNRLPLYVRPALYFFHRYVVRLGFLDGKEGFLFHFLQAYWYRLVVDMNTEQLQKHFDAHAETDGTRPGDAC